MRASKTNKTNENTKIRRLCRLIGRIGKWVFGVITSINDTCRGDRNTTIAIDVNQLNR